MTKYFKKNKNFISEFLQGQCHILEDYLGEYLQSGLGKQMESAFWNRNISHFPDQSYSNQTRIERKRKSID